MMNSYYVDLRYGECCNLSTSASSDYHPPPPPKRYEAKWDAGHYTLW